ncbi:MAG TPA: ion channel [Stellaceae bacterium]|jgi:voltage-gated potassium channel|nr:ion channel [Stellaceae bacterium]
MPKASFGRASRPWPLLLTVGLVGLIALAIAAAESYLAALVVVAILGMVVSFRLVFGSSRSYCLTLANLVAVYACLFLFFAESNFAGVRPAAWAAAFIMPLLAFAAGSLRHRSEIARIAAAAHLRGERHVLHILSWLMPVFLIGIASFSVPGLGLRGQPLDGALLAAMAAISIIVFRVSRDIAVFLLDTGLLFEEFFRRSERLLVPAFAFLSCYSLLVIVFASLYTVIDHALGGLGFSIEGAHHAISFSESLYFSLMTLSTVGYGDISPANNVIRLVAGAEIVFGILLLLFGFNEIFSFARSQERAGTGNN